MASVKVSLFGKFTMICGGKGKYKAELYLMARDASGDLWEQVRGCRLAESVLQEAGGRP